MNIAVGVAAAALGSALVSVGVAGTAGYISHSLESLPWLLGVTALPAAIAAFVLGLLPLRSRPTAGRIWAAALLTALLVVAVAGSIGAIVLQTVRFGFSDVNATGYFRLVRGVDQFDLMSNVRGYLRSTQRNPDVVCSYFNERHVRYAAA